MSAATGIIRVESQREFRGNVSTYRFSVLVRMLGGPGARRHCGEVVFVGDAPRAVRVRERRRNRNEVWAQVKADLMMYKPAAAKPRRVRVADCPHCGKVFRVQRRGHGSPPIWMCTHCYLCLRPEGVPSRLVAPEEAPQ